MPGEATAETGWETNFPPSFCETPDGKLILTNGVRRGRIFDGLTAAPELLGLLAPTSVATITPDSGGAATAGDYVTAVRFIDDEGFPSNLSALVTTTMTSNQEFNWSNIPQPTDDRATHIELYRSTSGQAITLYKVGTVTDGTTTFLDQASDDTISALAELPILNPNGSANANQFTPPPTHKAVAVMFQDRCWYGVDVEYNIGTITLTGSSDAVTGSGTAWTSDMAGRYLYALGDTRGYEIESVGSATGLTLVENYAGSLTGGGTSYVIRPAPAERGVVYFSAVWDADAMTGPEAVLGTNQIRVQENVGDNDEITGLMPLGGLLYVLKERHIYAIDFVRQPDIEAGVNLSCFRGCLNQRCWTVAEGVTYLLDKQGIYRFSGGNPESISDPIQDLFRDGGISWTNAKWFTADVDEESERVLFFVQFAGDSGTRPTRALGFNYRTGAWEPDLYPWEIGGTARVTISGRRRLLLGAEDDVVLLHNQGYLDGLDSTTETGTTRGTVTSADATSLTDSTATFPTGVVTGNATVYIVAGTGKGQERRILTRNSATKISVAAWTTVPSTDSVYQIGGVEWSAKFGILPWTEKKGETRRLVAISEPTDGDALLDLRLYFDRSSTPFNWGMTVASAAGQGIGTTAGDPDAVCDLERDDGVHELHFPSLGRTGEREWFVTPQIRGALSGRRIALYAIEADLTSPKKEAG